MKEALKIMETGELANLNKHLVTIRIGGTFYSYDAQMGLKEKDMTLDHFLIAADRKDFIGETKSASINVHAGKIVKSIQAGVLWHFAEGGDQIDKVIISKVLYNPHSMYLMKA